MTTVILRAAILLLFCLEDMPGQERILHNIQSDVSELIPSHLNFVQLPVL